MTRSLAVSGVLAFVVGLCGAAPRAASAADLDPEAVARRCVAKVEHLAERCVARNEAVCQRIVAAIRKALANGNERQAHRIAALGRRVIHRQTQACVKHITSLCRHCVHLLERLGAPDELIERVKNACEDAIAKVQASAERCLARIAEALEGGGGTGDVTSSVGAVRG
jgi:hypothetical protein